MVKLEEVPDEELNAPQPGPIKEEEDEWDTDDGTLAYPSFARYLELIRAMPQNPRSQK